VWHIILSVVLALLFLATGSGKVLGLAFANRNRDALEVSPLFWRFTGALEWAGAGGLVIGIWLPPLGVTAAVGLGVLMVGAIVVRIRAALLSGQPLREIHGLDRAVSLDVVVLALAVIEVVLIVRGF
jgi:uncharacterized membrane protein YphA (DoxX/SURF4 family)